MVLALVLSGCFVSLHERSFVFEAWLGLETCSQPAMDGDRDAVLPDEAEVSDPNSCVSQTQSCDDLDCRMVLKTELKDEE